MLASARSLVATTTSRCGGGPTAARGGGPGHRFAVCNGRYFGGGMVVAPDARMDDGLFDLTIWKGLGFVDFLTKKKMLYDGSHVRLPNTTRLRARTVEPSRSRARRSCSTWTASSPGGCRRAGRSPPRAEAARRRGPLSACAGRGRDGVPGDPAPRPTSATTLEGRRRRVPGSRLRRALRLAARRVPPVAGGGRPSRGAGARRPAGKRVVLVAALPGDLADDVRLEPLRRLALVAQLGDGEDQRPVEVLVEPPARLAGRQVAALVDPPSLGERPEGLEDLAGDLLARLGARRAGAGGHRPEEALAGPGPADAEALATRSPGSQPFSTSADSPHCAGSGTRRRRKRRRGFSSAAAPTPARASSAPTTS